MNRISEQIAFDRWLRRGTPGYRASRVRRLLLLLVLFCIGIALQIPAVNHEAGKKRAAAAVDIKK